MKEKFKNLFSFVMRFGLSALLLGWLFTKIDFKQIGAIVKSADPGYLALAGAVYFGINFLILWRWMIIMKALKLKVGFFSAVRWFYLGLFCSLFLPTSVGGDVVKGIGLAKETQNKPKVFASIVLDRLIGFAGIVLTASFAFLGGHKIIDDASIIVSIVGMAVLSAGLLVMLFSHRFFLWGTKVFSLWPRLKEGLMKLHYDVVLLKGHVKESVITVLLSSVAQLILAVEFYLTAKGLHQDIHLLYFVIFSPLVCVATSLPSIGGLGVREVGWVYFLSKVGVHQGVAVSLSLINFAFMVIVGLLGGLMYVATLSFRRVQHSQSGAAFVSGNA